MVFGVLGAQNSPMPLLAITLRHCGGLARVVSVVLVNSDCVDLAAVPRDVLDLCERLRSQGKRAWIVGGCVRDLLRGSGANDWDVATDARPNELLRIFPRAIPTGIEHGTVTVVKDKHHYEVTTLRGEGTYTDGRRPDWVEFVDDITADLARRDFTVNAIAVDPVRRPTHRSVRRAEATCGAASSAPWATRTERFSEDGLRVLRAARFVATLGLELDPATERPSRRRSTPPQGARTSACATSGSRR